MVNIFLLSWCVGMDQECDGSNPVGKEEERIAIVFL